MTANSINKSLHKKNHALDNPLEQLINPRSIAFLGASNNPMKMGTIQALSIIKDGFPGQFYPLHQTEKEVLGYRAYQSAFDLPEVPDLVMFVLPAHLVVEILEDFGKIGTKRAIVITAGFRETGEKGLQLEEKLKEVADRYGIRFLGPNCMGILNTSLPLNVTVLPFKGQPGLLGMVSQSGTYITQSLDYLAKKGIRFSKAISVGNEANLDITDCLEYLGQDEQTKAIALYIEGLKDARRFLETARRITPYKPVVAQYVGGSSAGARAGSSHTGAMAGPDYLYDGLFKQAGILRVHSVEELYNQGWVLATQPPLQGRRIAVLTNSGGPGTAMAHICNQGGLEIPTFSAALQEAIGPHVMPFASTGNPVDLTVQLETSVLSSVLPELIMKSGEIDGLVIHGLMGEGFMKALYPHLADLLGGISEEDLIGQFKVNMETPLSLPAKYGLPVIFSSFFGREDNFTAAYQDHNIPFFDGPEKAASGMVALHHYNLIRKLALEETNQLPPQSAAAVKIIQAALQKGQHLLDEHSSKQILAAYGVPISKDALAHNVEEAVAFASKLGCPVVLKGCSAELAHKTGHGLIHLGLESEAAVREAFDSIIKAAGQEIPVLVSKMAEGKREFMGGMVRYPGFGPCLVFGLGGVYAEALRDTVFRIAPLSAQEAREMTTAVRSADMLQGFRGLPPVDKDALAGILQATGNLALLHPEIAEIDLNPIMITGSDPLVVDALIVLRNQ